MQIIDMNKSHVDAVSKISFEQFKETSWSRNLFLKELDEKIYKKSMVAIVNDEVVGFVNVSFNDLDLTLLNLGVKEFYKRQKVGTELLRKVFDFAKLKQIQKIFLEVEESNLPAINLYKSFGFEIFNIRKKYYPNGSNALEMVIAL